MTARKKKKEYEIKVEREVREVLWFTVEAENEDEARILAIAEADEANDNEWDYDCTIDQRVVRCREES